MARAGGGGRFGFGQLSASVGVLLLGVGVAQPWLKLDAPKAFAEALRNDLGDSEVAARVLSVFSGPIDRAKDSPQAVEVARQLGVAENGWEQNHYLAAAVVVAAVLALIGVVRSVTAQTAWAARSQSPMLALSGLTALTAAGLALWVVAPAPKAAMRPDVGLWLLTGGGVLLLLGALTLGNNRRRPWIDELDDEIPKKAFDNTEHLTYSHGAWVPKLPDDH